LSVDVDPIDVDAIDHLFHLLGDRIDFSHLSDVAPESVVIDPSAILPNAADLDAVKKEFQVLVSR